MNTDTEERVRQIRERWSRSSFPEMVFTAHAKQDVDCLLSLLDSYSAGVKEFAEKTYRGQYEAVNDAATRMREACVTKVRELRDEWESKRNGLEPLSKMRNRYDAAFCAANEVITALDSLPLEQGEREKWHGRK